MSTISKAPHSLYQGIESFSYSNAQHPMLPKIIRADDVVDTSYLGTFEIHCELGMGHTIGHALRRILLSNFSGIAPVAIKARVVNAKNVVYAKHQFDVLPGVSESLFDIIMNIRKLYIQKKKPQDMDMKNDVFINNEPQQGFLVTFIGGTPGVLTVAHTEVNCLNLEIMNKNTVLCTLDANTSIYIDICFGEGYGACAAENHKFTPFLPEGYIAIDSYFSPIISYDYNVEEMTGVSEAYDKLTIKLNTNFIISPSEALQTAAALLRNNVSILAGDADIKMNAQEEEQLDDILLEKIDKLPLNIRTKNCLKGNYFTILADIVPCTPEELLVLPGFGTGCLDDLLRVLQELGLNLGMKIKPQRSK